MKKCSVCKTMLEDEELYCHECGSKQEIEDIKAHVEETCDPIKKTCIHCGEIIEEDSAFCPYCGKPQTMEDTKATEPEQIETPVVVDELKEVPRQEISDDQTCELEEEDKSKKWVWILCAIVLLCIIGGAGYFYTNNQEDIPLYVQDIDSIAENTDSIAPKDDTSSMDMDVEQGLKEVLSALITYNGEMYLPEHFTEAFNAYYSRVCEKAVNEGKERPRIWWQYSNDYPTEYSVNSINAISSSESIANIKVMGASCRGIYDVTLKIENGHWKIDSISEKESNSKEVQDIENKKSFIEEMYDVFFGSRKSESYDIDNVKKYLSQRVVERITLESPYEDRSYYILDHFRDGSLGFDRPDYGKKVVNMEINNIDGEWFEVLNFWDKKETPVKVRLKIVEDKNGNYKVVDFK